MTDAADRLEKIAKRLDQVGNVSDEPKVHEEATKEIRGVAAELRKAEPAPGATGASMLRE